MAFIPATPLPVSGLRAASPATAPLRAARAPARATRMIAAEPAAAPAAVAAPELVLTPRATQLLSYIRAHKSIFRAGLGFTSTTAALFRKNDTGRSFTPAVELQTSAHELPGADVAAFILEEHARLVQAAVDAAGVACPAVAANEKLAYILEWNMFTVLRAISYGAASQSDDFVHENNIGMMKMLHDELQLPAATITAAINAMKDIVLASVSEDDIKETTGACFDAMSTSLS